MYSSATKNPNVRSYIEYNKSYLLCLAYFTQPSILLSFRKSILVMWAARIVHRLRYISTNPSVLVILYFVF